MDEQEPIEEAGFRTDFSTIDHMHALKQLLEKCQEYDKALYIEFVVFNKAFDSVRHNSPWKALTEQGVPKKYIRIIENENKNNMVQIKLVTPDEEFPIARGVRRGDPLSPKLFSAILESEFRNLEWKNIVININDKKLNHLRFADDLVPVIDYVSTLQQVLQQLTEKSRIVGLLVNRHKSG